VENFSANYNDGKLDVAPDPIALGDIMVGVQKVKHSFTPGKHCVSSTIYDKGRKFECLMLALHPQLPSISSM
jgi:hypothetical protein